MAKGFESLDLESKHRGGEMKRGARAPVTTGGNISGMRMGVLPQRGQCQSVTWEGCVAGMETAAATGTEERVRRVSVSGAGGNGLIKLLTARVGATDPT